MEVNVTCLPTETTYIKVRFILQMQAATNLYIDNVKIELHN